MREKATATDGNNLASTAESKRVCRGCNPGIFRRINRSTLLERTLFTWLGFFPWECVSCRRKSFFRAQNRKPAR